MRGTLASAAMRKPTRRTEVGRGERVVPGVWRLRLPLPWPGVPHCNAWALAAGDGIVLVDCGMDAPGSMAHLERALEQVGLRLEHVRLLVCTHAHVDHCGQAAAIQARTGCPLWIHPRHEHLTALGDDPEAALARRIEIARQSGVPEAPLRGVGRAPARREQRHERAARPRARPAARRRGGDRPRRVARARDARPRAVARRAAPARAAAAAVRRPRARPHLALLRPRLDARPGGASSSPRSTGVDALDVRLTLSGHGRPFTDLHGHVEGNRALVGGAARRGPAPRSRDRGEATAFDLLPPVYGERLMPGDRRLAADEDALLPRAPRARGARAAAATGEPTRWSAA